jgi:hypothetical protein
VVVAQMIIYRNGFGKVLGLGGAGSSWETWSLCTRPDQISWSYTASIWSPCFVYSKRCTLVEKGSYVQDL